MFSPFHAVGDFNAYGLKLSAAGEAFVVAVAIYLLLVAFGRLLKRRFGVRLGQVYQLFCAATGPYLAVVALYPSLSGRSELAALSALLGTGVFIRLVDQYFWRWYFEETRKTPVPKFIREVTAAVLLLVTVLLILNFNYHTNLQSLLTITGVSGIVLGLALQDSLGNIIAGLALQIGRPFAVGDWLHIDNQHVQAVEINWRSTRFITNDEVQLDVPNQQIVRQTITNYHGGGSRHAMRFEIGIDCDTPPNRVKDALARATASAAGVLAEPAPMVFLKNFGDSAIIYEVRYWIDDHRLYNTISDAIRTNIWYTLRRQSIKTPYPVRTLQIERSHVSHTHRATGQHDRRDAICELLRNQALFQSMGADHLKALVAHSPLQHYGQGEAIIREGAGGSSMFVLVSGEAGVTVETAGQSARVATLHSGDCFGEMSLLTGEKRSASVLAVKDCEVLEITKPVFADIVARDAGLLPRLSELLARRQMETEGIQARVQQSTVIDARQQEYQKSFMTKLKSFFEL